MHFDVTKEALRSATIDTSSARKPILCLDWDGVIHSYEDGWRNGEIYGTATPGFFAWAIEAAKLFKLVIYSSRSKAPTGTDAMREALRKWTLAAVVSGEISETDRAHILNQTDFAHEKPPAFLTIDDRAVTFMGNWSKLKPAELRAFKPWNVGK